MKPVESIDDLMEMAWAFRASRVLMIAHKLDIFTMLSKGSHTAGEISNKCRCDADMTDRLLIACCALGLLTCKNGLYENTELASKYLVRESPFYQGGWIDHAAQDLWEYWGEGIEKEIGGEKRETTEWTTRFISAMHGLAMSGEAEELVNVVDLKGRKKLYDVGGGPGTYSIFLCKTYPDLKAVVFDLPETIRLTKEIIKEFGLSDRIQTREGSWDKEDFGSDNDVVLMSNILHGKGSDAEMKLKKAHRSLKSGGLLIIRDFILYDDKSGPISPALFNLMVGAFTMGEIKAIIGEAGFKNVREVKVPHKIHSIILADKP